jgi:hypothetical protein
MAEATRPPGKLVRRKWLGGGPSSKWKHISEQLRFNVNFGFQFNTGDPRGLFASGGVGASWNFVPQFPQWSVIAEVFGLFGSGQSNPRYQNGIRYSPTKDFDWDVIYGRNLTGEGANWITLALSIRIGDN